MADVGCMALLKEAGALGNGDGDAESPCPVLAPALLGTGAVLVA
jgi:hypothetical protein